MFSRFHALMVLILLVGVGLWQSAGWPRPVAVDQSQSIELEPVPASSPFPAVETPLPGVRFIQQSVEQTSYRPEIQGRSYSHTHERDHVEVLRAFRDVIGNQWMSTVRVLVGGEHRAMGIVVDPRGWIITKSSELSGDQIQCRLYDDSRVPADMMVRRSDLDLALLRLNFGKRTVSLEAASWSEEDPKQVGSWVATTDIKKLPMAVGVVSVLPRTIRRENVVLGVEFEKGRLHRIKNVIPGTGADRAGLQEGDTIMAVNGVRPSDGESIAKLIGRHKAGQEIELEITRGNDALQVRATLMDLNSSLLDPTEMEVNGPVSDRSTGFSRAIQHDTVLTPNQCGGPLLNLKGEVIGINIARAGRVSTYALPSNLVKQAVGEMFAELVNAKGAPKAQSIDQHGKVIIRAQDTPLAPAQ